MRLFKLSTCHTVPATAGASAREWQQVWMLQGGRTLRTIGNGATLAAKERTPRPPLSLLTIFPFNSALFRYAKLQKNRRKWHRRHYEITKECEGGGAAAEAGPGQQAGCGRQAEWVTGPLFLLWKIIVVVVAPHTTNDERVCAAGSAVAAFLRKTYKTQGNNSCKSSNYLKIIAIALSLPLSTLFALSAVVVVAVTVEIAKSTRAQKQCEKRSQQLQLHHERWRESAQERGRLCCVCV